MNEDKIIQKNLFVINNETSNQIIPEEIPDDLSIEDLKKESTKRPRKRKNSRNLVSKFKNEYISENKNNFINEKSYSYETVDKSKLTQLRVYMIYIRKHMP